MRVHAGSVLVLLVTAAVLNALQVNTGPLPLAGGGDVLLRRAVDTLEITVRGPRAGLASVCVGDDSRVRILHASAALGEAVYERTGDQWTLTSGFDFRLRDTRAGPPTDADRSAYLASLGWVANSSRLGDVPRQFTIRLTERVRFVGVTFFTTSEPMTVSYWPAAMDDACAAVKVAQGFLPETAQFRPATWHRILLP